MCLTFLLLRLRVCRSLKQLEWVALETLRLRPPAYLVGRCCSAPVQLGSHHLPAGEDDSLAQIWLHAYVHDKHPQLTCGQPGLHCGLCCCCCSAPALPEAPRQDSITHTLLLRRHHLPGQPIPATSQHWRLGGCRELQTAALGEPAARQAPGQHGPAAGHGPQ